MDHHRALRKGFPEVVLGEGKTPEQAAAIAERLAAHSERLLITRAARTCTSPSRSVCRTPRITRPPELSALDRGKEPRRPGVAVCCAGTSDIPVAEEAAVTAELMGSVVDRMYDVGVAGLHRLLDKAERLRAAKAIVVVAGMEGALPSVVAGLVAAPVIAVPTSIGYGASFRGLAPLLAMLNACAAGVAVVNIDNGFGAGYMAAVINRQTWEGKVEGETGNGEVKAVLGNLHRAGIAVCLLASACGGGGSGEISEDEARLALPKMVLQEADLPEGLQRAGEDFTTNQQLVESGVGGAPEAAKVEEWGRVLGYETDFQAAELPSGPLITGIDTASSVYKTPGGASASFEDTARQARDADWTLVHADLEEFQEQEVQRNLPVDGVLWLRLSGLRPRVDGRRTRHGSGQPDHLPRRPGAGSSSRPDERGPRYRPERSPVAGGGDAPHADSEHPRCAPGAGLNSMTRIAYLDCFSGVSGDMLLGAIVDAGAEPASLRRELGKLRIEGYTLDSQRVTRAGIAATQALVAVAPDQPPRTLADVLDIIDTSTLPSADKEKGSRVFQRLAESEAKVHGETIETVHLHDVGAVDAIVDVMGTVAGLRLLEVEELFASALPSGSGSVKGPHGVLPVPAPATLELLARANAPVRAAEGVTGELVTPTGAAIVTTLAKFERPEMTLQRAGYGAGSREVEGRPNVLRLWLGDGMAVPTRPMLLIETNIDDMTGEMLGYARDKLLDAGAKDVWFTSIQMKKGRPGVILSVICTEAEEEAIARLLLRETSTLGVRVRPVHRWEAEREVVEFESSLGRAAVKVKRILGERSRVAPEYEACKQLAEATGLPLAEVYRVVHAEGEARVVADS